jgi:hypothetical protein
MKAAIGIAFLAVLGALGSALVFMLRGRQQDAGGGRRMLTALRIRVALSMALLAFILVGWWLGWIEPRRYG